MVDHFGKFFTPHGRQKLVENYKQFLTSLSRHKLTKKASFCHQSEKCCASHAQMEAKLFPKERHHWHIVSCFCYVVSLLHFKHIANAYLKSYDLFLFKTILISQRYAFRQKCDFPDTLLRFVNHATKLPPECDLHIILLHIFDVAST